MFDICALGEILIDAIATADKNVQITGNAGGAPANVLACAAKLGLKTAIIAKTGDDFIGNWLKGVLDAAEICTSGLVLDPDKNTTIAMVTLDEKGDRSFAFYRNGCADVSLTAQEVNLEMIRSSKIFHFGSVSMTDEPSRSATLYAARYAGESERVVSYDPNLRRNLWQSEDCARKYIKEGLALCDIAKLAEDECSFLFEGGSLHENARRILWENPRLKLLFVTCGEKGSYVFTADAVQYAPSFEVRTVDTTGAGDAFVGAVLYQILKHDQKLTGYSQEELQEMVRFGNAVGALSVQKMGAIPAMPAREEVEQFLRDCAADGYDARGELIS